MIEKEILDYLMKGMSVPVYMETEPDMPTAYVLIEKVGSGEDNHIHRATIAIQSYAGTLFEAAAINELVKQIMKESVTLHDICRCDLNSDYNYTDATKKQHRYQAVFDIAHY